MVLRGEASEDAIVGKHVFGNLYSCEEDRIADEEYLRNLAVQAAQTAGMTVCDVKSWAFGGPKGGVSVVVLVTESHVAIHCWTEYRYATVDVFTCGDKSNPDLAFGLILEGLRPKHYSAYRADRSSRPRRAVPRQEMGPPPAIRDLPRIRARVHRTGL